MHSDVVAERLRDTDDDVCYEAPVFCVALMVIFGRVDAES